MAIKETTIVMKGHLDTIFKKEKTMTMTEKNIVMKWHLDTIS